MKLELKGKDWKEVLNNVQFVVNDGIIYYIDETEGLVEVTVGTMETILAQRK